MLRHNATLLLCVFSIVFGSLPLALGQQAIPVALKKSSDRWELLRDGKPYQIRGAGGMGPLTMLAECGGNSNRTWGDGPEIQQRLDEAHKNGISVAMGIWLEHERHGFNYSDAAAVQKQKETALAVVRKYKDHPAILVWGVGNEMEGDGRNQKVFQHVEDICKEIKNIDPLHPTMTVIAEIGGNKVQSINKHCPNVDIVGINSYGGSASLPRRYREAGGVKPFVVTEFGPVGTWEIPKNEFGAIYEPRGSAKAETYKKAIAAFNAEKELCLGYYAFLWGNKQEATPTWFGMLLPDNKKTAPVDVLVEEWTGKPAKNLCPVITEMRFIGDDQELPGKPMQVVLEAEDPEGKPLNVKWTVLKDSAKYVTGGDKQAVPPSVPGVLLESNSSGAKLVTPKETGVYRVYAYVDDGVGAAVANLPFFVGSKDIEGMKEPETLPYYVYKDSDAPKDFAPSGWMGETDGIKMDENYRLEPHSGSSCIEFRYLKPTGWGGVVWQNPPEDWGDKIGGVNLTGASKLTFWAKSANGGEEIKFGFGLLGRDKKFFDTAKKEVAVKLTNEWKQYTIEFGERADMRRIKTAFYWSLAANGKEIRFFLDDIQFEK